MSENIEKELQKFLKYVGNHLVSEIRKEKANEINNDKSNKM
jgi:hypothetical protein